MKKEIKHKNSYNFDDLVEIMRCLRAPDGCPWDSMQTHESIRPCLIEEAYELAEAIDLNNRDMMLEECGDVLLQAVFHALIAEDRKEFTMEDMMTMLCQKLLSRHTHIFGDVIANNETEAYAAWDSAKKKEKGQTTAADSLKSVAKTLPPVIRAAKVMKKAKKAGYTKTIDDSAINKVKTAEQELNKAIEEYIKQFESWEKP